MLFIATWSTVFNYSSPLDRLRQMVFICLSCLFSFSSLAYSFTQLTYDFISQRTQERKWLVKNQQTPCRLGEIGRGKWLHIRQALKSLLLMKPLETLLKEIYLECFLKAYLEKLLHSTA